MKCDSMCCTSSAFREPLIGLTEVTIQTSAGKLQPSAFQPDCQLSKLSMISSCSGNCSSFTFLQCNQRIFDHSFGESRKWQICEEGAKKVHAASANYCLQQLARHWHPIALVSRPKQTCELTNPQDQCSITFKGAMVHLQE